MLGSAFETLFALVGTYGAVVLLCVFVLEGALVGKLIPTRTLFVATVLAVGTSLIAFLPVLIAAVVGATLGQLLLFVLVRRFDVDPAESRLVPIAPDRADGAADWFDRWGLPAVAVSNTVPGIRGWLAVPSAGSSVSASRFAAASLAGSTAYAGALVIVAFGLEGAASALIGL
ncbi:membrane protein DedA with SNARE-associated domain [Halorubrum alkaliphilum]|uniref:Membrane protein DedA with SNARE-associated domain n=1 Tax=Halorubrum alkaliphilum TaxID=261290 RepID=A0A8T4GEI9_9EURY|nr:VTT domain-containing protein [Halorubrum alkaliphilum]MBP1921881.1 membrane protein DedA with SNARE-associated domain [Halorubrum alkaliphilum]